MTTTELPSGFRHVRMLLAREKARPSGNRGEGYDLLLPLLEDGRIDPAAWKKHQMRCRIRSFGPGRDDRIGRLRRKPGGQWYFDYEEGDRDDEPGFRLGDEKFVTGEYVSVAHGDVTHTYQVARVERP